MPMRIRGNWASLLSWRNFSKANSQQDLSLQRLSSGLRINSASDDAAGLSVSQKVLGQFKGLVRASRNAMDGISLLNTAEGSLHEIHSMLQRGRELSLQAANGTLTASDRGLVQLEIDQILREIDRISDGVSFNGQRLLNTAGNSAALAATLDGLRSGWLEQAEQVIRNAYGVFGDDEGLTIVFENSGQSSTWISGTPDAGGRLTNLSLHINLADFGSGGGPDGGMGPLYNDRKVARGLTQAVLARNTIFTSLEEWFISGVSDYIPGNNEQLRSDVSTYGAPAVINAVDSAWSDSSLQQSSAYLAVRYLDYRLGQVGSDMSSFLSTLSWSTLDDALFSHLFISTTDEFIDDFQLDGAGFLAGLNLNSPSDVGGIAGGDAVQVIPNTGTYSLNPLDHFSINWPNRLQSDPLEVVLQVGANAYDTLRFYIPEVSTLGLGLVGVNVVSGAQEAIDKFGTAIDTVSSVRTYLGSISNRLEHTINTNEGNSESQLSGYSRVVDLDMAHDLTNLTRQQILVSSSSAMLAQANSVRQHVMWLLNGMGPSNSAVWS